MTDHSPASPQTPSAIVPPLTLDAKGELLFFKTPAHLEACVEAADVINGEYGACWDGEGRLLELEVDDDGGRLLGMLHGPVVRVVPTAQGDTPPHPGELDQALLGFLITIGLEDEMPTTNDPADVLAFAIEHAGWS